MSAFQQFSLCGHGCLSCCTRWFYLMSGDEGISFAILEKKVIK